MSNHTGPDDRDATAGQDRWALLEPFDRLWPWFLSGGNRVDIEDPNYLRVAMINVIGAVAGLLWGLFLLYNLWTWPTAGNTARVLVDAFGLAVSVAMLVSIRLNIPIDTAARLANIGAAAAALALVYVRPDPTFSLMVLALYPVLAFFLLDNLVKGIAWTAGVTLTVCAMVLGGLGPWAQPGLGTAEGVATIGAAMIMQSVTMAAYVRSRRHVLRRLEQVRAELAEQSIHDPLTGLYNRRTFEDCLRRYLARAARGPDGLAVAMIDIDHFKAYNDTYGHPDGDAVLCAIARVLGRIFTRGEDIVFRLGGEELCVLFFVRSSAEARHMGERACEAIQALGFPSPATPGEHLTVSLGLTWVAPGQRLQADAVYCQADDALYRAKAAGRGLVVESQGSAQE